MIELQIDDVLCRNADIHQLTVGRGRGGPVSLGSRCGGYEGHPYLTRRFPDQVQELLAETGARGRERIRGQEQSHSRRLQETVLHGSVSGRSEPTLTRVQASRDTRASPLSGVS